VFGFSLVIDGMKKMMRTSKICLSMRDRMVLGCKSMFDFSQMRRLKKMMRSLQVAPNVITIFNVNKCPKSKRMMGIYESQTK